MDHGPDPVGTRRDPPPDVDGHRSPLALKQARSCHVAVRPRHDQVGPTSVGHIHQFGHHRPDFRVAGRVQNQARGRDQRLHFGGIGPVRVDFQIVLGRRPPRGDDCKVKVGLVRRCLGLDASAGHHCRIKGLDILQRGKRGLLRF